MSKTFIIAEAGVNHNGSLDIAKKMIEIAADAGADAVKFQTFKAETLVSTSAPKADYQKETTRKEESQFDMIKKLELNTEAHKILYDYCKAKNIFFLSSPFDLESIDLLNDLGMNIFKLPSGEITNLPYLRKIGRLGKKVILSTGMANMEEIKDALKILIDSGTQKENITVLHTNTEYPTPYKDVNLNAMLTIKQKFNIETGLSDHSPGIEVPIAAVALGAVIIEKHFTLDKNLPGPDHKASLEPAELKQMITSIRNIEKALGDGIKKPSPSELKNINIARKSIHLVTNLKAGHILEEKDLIMKRPGDGISPMRMDKITGRKLKTDLHKDTKLSLKDLE